MEDSSKGWQMGVMETEIKSGSILIEGVWFDAGVVNRSKRLGASKQLAVIELFLPPPF